MVTLVLASLIVIAHDEPPPPPPPAVLVAVEPAPPREPSWSWLGLRFGLANTAVLGHDRTMATFGLQTHRVVTGALRAFGEYELAVVMAGSGADGEGDWDVYGRGHIVRAGLRHPLLDTTIDKGEGPIRLYADLEVAAGAALLSDNLLGTNVLPIATGGLRLGYEIYKRDGGEPSTSAIDGHMVFRAQATRDDVSFVFGAGFEWGTR